MPQRDEHVTEREHAHCIKADFYQSNTLMKSHVFLLALLNCVINTASLLAELDAAIASYKILTKIAHVV